MSEITYADLKDGDLVMARWPYTPDTLVLLIFKNGSLYGPCTVEGNADYDYYGHPTRPDTWSNSHSTHEVLAILGNWNDAKPVDDPMLDLGEDIVEAVHAAGYELVKKD